MWLFWLCVLDIVDSMCSVVLRLEELKLLVMLWICCCYCLIMV